MPKHFTMDVISDFADTVIKVSLEDEEKLLSLLQFYDWLIDPEDLELIKSLVRRRLNERISGRSNE